MLHGISFGGPVEYKKPYGEKPKRGEDDTITPFGKIKIETMDCIAGHDHGPHTDSECGTSGGMPIAEKCLIESNIENQCDDNGDNERQEPEAPHFEKLVVLFHGVH